MFVRVERFAENETCELTDLYRKGKLSEFTNLVDSGTNINYCLSSGLSLISQVLINAYNHDNDLNKKFFDVLLDADVHLGKIGFERPLFELSMRSQSDEYYMEKLLNKNVATDIIDERIDLSTNFSDAYLYEYPIFTLVDQEEYSLEKIKLFLKSNPDLTLLDKGGSPILNFIISDRCERLDDLFELFIKHGADPNQVGKYDGHTPFHKLMEFSLANFPAAFVYCDILLKHNVDINTRCKKGKTALMKAASTGNMDAVKYLINNGADVDIADNEGIPAFMHAVIHQKYDVFYFLCNHIKDVTIQDNAGNNVSHHMASHNSLKELNDKRDRWFKNNPGLMTVQNSKNRTPKDIIAINRRPIRRSLGI